MYIYIYMLTDECPEDSIDPKDLAEFLGKKGSYFMEMSRGC